MVNLLSPMCQISAAAFRHLEFELSDCNKEVAVYIHSDHQTQVWLYTIMCKQLHGMDWSECVLWTLQQKKTAQSLFKPLCMLTG